MRLVPSNVFKPSNKKNTDLFKTVLFEDPFCYLGFVSVMLNVCSLQPCSQLLDLIALLFVMFSCVFVTFPYGVLGQVWYLIVSIPDFLLLPCSYSAREVFVHIHYQIKIK